jgi:NADH:ubiquinone oxidoreductase 24 kD subunit
MIAPIIDPGRVAKVLFKYPASDPSALVDVLHDLQSEFRYLPAEALTLAARHLGMPESAVFSVTTFYQGFHLKPRGEHVCIVCMGTACHVRGSPRLLTQLELKLQIQSGQTTGDLQFSLEEVNCVGACALGPLVILDGVYHGHMTATRLSKLVDRLRSKKGGSQ